MVNNGIGEAHLNNLLAAMNLPLRSHSSLKVREREVGLAIENVACILCDKATEEEKQLL